MISLLVVIAFFTAGMSLVSALLNHHAAAIKVDPQAKTPLTMLGATRRGISEVLRGNWPAMLISSILYYLSLQTLLGTWQPAALRTFVAMALTSHAAAIGYYWSARTQSQRDASSAAQALLRGLREGLKADDESKDHPRDTPV